VSSLRYVRWERPFPPVRALLASARPRHVCGSGSPAFITGGAPHRCIWPVVHGGCALSPLLPLPFPQLLPHCEDLGPTPRRPSAPAT